MSFQTGLSGLSVSGKTLDVIGNNIANANTVGFKSSRNEFSELVSASLGSAGGAGVGIGVATSTIAQQFSQGNINITGNSLDIAINGSGFFQVTKLDGTAAYTRDGQFKLDKDGNIITNTGSNLMGYPTDLVGNPTSVTPQRLSIPTSAPIPANQTTTVTAEFNLDARAKVANSVTPPIPVGAYGTSLSTYDSQGVPLPLNLYFSRIDSTAWGIPQPSTLPVGGYDTWAIYDTSVVDQVSVAPLTDPMPIGYMAFDATGKLVATYGNDASVPPTIPPPVPPVGAPITENLVTLGHLSFQMNPAAPSIVPPFMVDVDLSDVTQFGTAFNVSNLTQDGYTAGDLTGVTIEPTGVITTRYSNGQTQSKGQLALADFRNIQGLEPLGGGEYLETFKSGQPVQGSPGVGKFGELRAGSVEESNVDLTAELVNMMTAQRNYQANAQTIKTQDQVMQTLVNLR
ncbi:MAG: flagellar hook protein FlgE [Rhodoferax sp.]|nr:flagellar hook protein FlgE [Rhodoferax sp.]